MSFASITCDRGDRKPFMDFCRHQIERMTVKPDKSYFIDYPPLSDDFDLVARIRIGIQEAQKDGFDEVYILESDDFYPPDYFEKMRLGEHDFIGEEKSTYYNIRNRTWQTMIHHGRSSMFITGFKISSLNDFQWPINSGRYLDISLWDYAKKQKLKRKFVNSGAIGMKHNIGKVGGRGHVLTMKNTDTEMQWLKENVSTDAWMFYKTLNL